jgi:cytidine deaminase
MRDISNTELIRLATEVMQPKHIGDCFMGQVGSALITENGNIYRGVCLDIGSSVGFCAERTAISQMITNKEYKVKKIVAVWNDNAEKDLYVLPPCGVCRHFMFMVTEDSLDIDVVLGSEKTVKLKDLMPYHEWPEKEEVLQSGNGRQETP